MTILRISLEKIVENPWQTRRNPDPEYIKELSEDIKAKGLLQIPQGRFVDRDKKPIEGLAGLDKYNRGDDVLVQIAFGHCRLAAFKILVDADEFFQEMPVEMLELTDVEMADRAWSENEKRRDNSPLDRAFAIQKRIEDFTWTHEQVAEHLSISRSSVTNTLRLLKLPDNIQEEVHKRLVSERQALVLVSLYDLPEALRERAESGYDISRRPSTLVEMALEGAPADNLRSKMNEMIEAYAIDLSIAGWPLDHAFLDIAEKVRSVRCSACELKISRDGKELCGDSRCYQAKTVAWMKREVPPTPQPSPEPAPETTVEFAGETVTEETSLPEPEKQVHVQSHERAAPGSAKPAPAPAPATALTGVARGEPVKSVLAGDPYVWDKAQITATITWMPDDGDPRGRSIVMGVYSHRDAPIIRSFRQNDIQLEGALEPMLNELRERMEARSGQAEIKESEGVA